MAPKNRPADNPRPEKNRPAAAQSEAVEEGESSSRPRGDGLRETIESIVIAFVLAFLFRTFIAEAFVIPTGSMATTLLGRHRNVVCENCGLEYLASASGEVDKETGAREVQPNGELFHIVSTTCPNCRFKMDVSDESEFPSYKGDRILVNKFSYMFHDPQRWDVFVFRFPEQAQTNYIKRCVGGNGERIKLIHGDVWTADLEDMSAPFEIAKKPHDVAEATLRLVYDNDHIGDHVGLPPAAWPVRWTPCPKEISRLVDEDGWRPRTGQVERDGQAIWPVALLEQGGWSTSDDLRSFSVQATDQTAWLRYRHYFPDAWSGLAAGPSFGSPRPKLILDSVAYNESEREPTDDTHPGEEWVRDLAVECEIDAEQKGQVVLELVEGGEFFHCYLDLATGAATLKFQGQSAEAVAKDAFSPCEPFSVRFANINNRLMLWINGDPVELAGDVDHNVTAERETDADYSPVGIAAQGATVTIRHLRVLRDIFYRNFSSDRRIHVEADANEAQALTYPLKRGQFFALGDNSAASQDSRAWYSVQHVDRDLLIGKAFFIYWPDSKHDPIPYWPNWSRMGFIK